MKFDVETFFNQLLPIMKTNLSIAIADINSEKGDDLLGDIDENAWFFQSLDDSTHNFSNFMFYYLDSMLTTVAGPQSTKDLTVEVNMFLFNNNDGQIETKVLRYRRALEEMMGSSWDQVGRGYDRAVIQSINTIDVKSLNSSAYYKVFGVSLNFTIS